MIKRKRLIAKIIDVVIYVPLVGVIYTAILGAIDKVASKDIVGTMLSLQTQYHEAVTQENTELANDIVVNNMEFLLQFSLISFVITFLILMVFATLFGKLFEGSIGKKIMKLKVKSTVREKVRLIEYLAREPLLYVNLVSIMTFAFFMFVYPSVLVYTFGSFAFLWALLLFTVGKTFWEKYTNTVVVLNEKEQEKTEISSGE